MIYSRWRPDTGGYDYYESAERHALGEDLPTPVHVSATALGIPSTEAGRKPRGALRRIGSGAVARGSILPIDRSGLSGLTLTFDWKTLALVAGGLLAGWYAHEQWGKS